MSKKTKKPVLVDRFEIGSFFLGFKNLNFEKPLKTFLQDVLEAEDRNYGSIIWEKRTYALDIPAEEKKSMEEAGFSIPHEFVNHYYFILNKIKVDVVDLGNIIIEYDFKKQQEIIYQLNQLGLVKSKLSKAKVENWFGGPSFDNFITNDVEDSYIEGDFDECYDESYKSTVQDIAQNGIHSLYFEYNPASFVIFIDIKKFNNLLNALLKEHLLNGKIDIYLDSEFDNLKPDIKNKLKYDRKIYKETQKELIMEVS